MSLDIDSPIDFYLEDGRVDGEGDSNDSNNAILKYVSLILQ